MMLPSQSQLFCQKQYYPFLPLQGVRHHHLESILYSWISIFWWKRDHCSFPWSYNPSMHWDLHPNHERVQTFRCCLLTLCLAFERQCLYKCKTLVFGVWSKIGDNISAMLSTLRLSTLTYIGRDEEKKLGQILTSLMELSDAAEFINPVDWECKSSLTQSLNLTIILYWWRILWICWR